jgi:hypothetical protein
MFLVLPGGACLRGDWNIPRPLNPESTGFAGTFEFVSRRVDLPGNCLEFRSGVLWVLVCTSVFTGLGLGKFGARSGNLVGVRYAGVGWEGATGEGGLESTCNKKGAT